MFAELDDEAEAAQVPAGQDHLRHGGHDGHSGPGTCRLHTHNTTTGLARLLHRESFIYLLLLVSSLVLDIRSTARQI